MPIPPRPRTYQCPQCHWRRSFAPQGDVLCLPPWVRRCPRCGHEGMQSRRADPLSALKARLWSLLG
ncbi:hypothetical protein [Paludibacterium sp. THUN1379]|uniref:hypothetical protein n=1 Tax=Paludibacterium sp. THUN1379 TaxID=3112107 RepID=UPI0030CD7323